jgi:hypothetical protein
VHPDAQLADVLGKLVLPLALWDAVHRLQRPSAQEA